MSNLPDLEDLLSELAFRCPELAPAVARVSARWDEKIETAGVNAYGDIRINPKMADVALQVLAHEVMHLVGVHYFDMPSPPYDHPVANIAADMWINAILEDMIPQVDWPKNWVYATGNNRQKSAREIYAEIYKKVKVVKIPGVGQGCGLEDGDDDGEARGQGKSPAGNPINQAVAAGIMAGIGSVLPRVNTILVPPPPQSSIPEVLREAASAGHGHRNKRSTFSRLGRRSTPEVPRRGKINRGPCLVVIVDVSGSMYGELEQIRKECAYLAGHARVHLILHDTEVLFTGRVGVDECTKRIEAGGGTEFSKAFHEADKVLKSWSGPGCVVHFTDGEVGDWPPPPAGTPAYAAICGNSIVAPAPWRTRHLPKK